MMFWTLIFYKELCFKADLLNPGPTDKRNAVQQAKGDRGKRITHLDFRYKT